MFSSFSTSFIAPSTYQLFSQYGNLDLEPEENKTFELGYSYTVSRDFELNSVFFYREEDNTIVLPDFVTYSNTNEQIIAKGVESEVKFNFSDGISFRIGHSYTYKGSDVDYIPKK